MFVRNILQPVKYRRSLEIQMFLEMSFVVLKGSKEEMFSY